VHPAVEAYVRKLEEEAIRKGSYRKKLGPNEIAFLEYVWGPEFDYNFEGLQAEYPLKDYKGGERFADFTYIRGTLRLLIEIDDFTTHARNISPGEFGDHLLRQNDFVLDGWIVLRFSAYHVKKHSMLCRRQLKQAIGGWWVRTQADNPFRGEGRTSAMRGVLTEMALRTGAPLKPAEVARAYKISRSTAMKWLVKFTEEGLFLPEKANKKVIGYRLNR